MLPDHPHVNRIQCAVVPLSERFSASKTAIIIEMVSSGKRVCASVPDDSCVYGAVGSDEVTSGRDGYRLIP